MGRIMQVVLIAFGQELRINNPYSIWPISYSVILVFYVQCVEQILKGFQHGSLPAPHFTIKYHAKLLMGPFE